MINKKYSNNNDRNYNTDDKSDCDNIQIRKS